MSQPFTICYVIIGLDYAGAEIQLLEVIRRMRARGHRVFVVSLLTPAAFVRELGAIGVSVISLDLERGEGLTLGLLMRFLRGVGRVRPEVIHGHMVHSNLLARLAAVVHRIPVAIATVHSIDEGGRARTWLYRLTERFGTLTTSVSEVGREVHVRSGASSARRILVVPNGIDLERFRRDEPARSRIRAELGVPPDRFVWLSVTRFEPPKDPPTLLRALDRLPSSSELWIVGQGSQRAETERLVDSLGLSDRVRFLGLRTDVPDLLSACDGFVLSSKAEAMPIAVLEAAAAEAPVVASDVGEVPTMIEHGRTGLVVPPSDPEALARALARLEGMSAAERQEMGAAARERVQKRWSLDAVVDRWESLYLAHLPAT